jgi:putative intracellular protease/amidase
MHDSTAIGKLCHSKSISDCADVTTEFDAIFMTGGHGTCTDFINNPPLTKAIEAMYGASKVVAAVCHGPICLTDCVKSDGSPLVEGLTVTGFSNTEEDAVQLSSVVPFLLETKFKTQGATYERGDDWTSKVCVSDKLVTGQNPQSTEECAEAVVQLLG